MKLAIKYRNKDKYPISEMCRFFEVSRSGYYSFVARMDVPDKDLLVTEEITKCQNVIKLMVTAEFAYGLTWESL